VHHRKVLLFFWFSLESLALDTLVLVHQTQQIFRHLDTPIQTRYIHGIGSQCKSSTIILPLGHHVDRPSEKALQLPTAGDIGEEEVMYTSDSLGHTVRSKNLTAA
jgi:hypothetical protein